MDKREFLRKLEKALKKLLPEERARYISYFDEIIMDLVDGGLSEKEAVAKQGNMGDIVADIMSQVEPEKVSKKNPWEIALFILVCLFAIACVIVLITLPDVVTFAMMDVDGPTSIFVAGKVNEPVWLYILTAIVLITSIVIFAIRKKGKCVIALSVALIICALTFVVVRIDDNKKYDNYSATETTNVYASKEVEDKTKEIIELVSNNDYQTLRDDYAVEEMKEVLNEEYMLEAKSMINDNWGELKSIGTVYAADVTQNNITYTVVQVNVTYENLSIAYTITFDENIKLAGVYFR